MKPTRDLLIKLFLDQNTTKEPEKIRFKNFLTIFKAQFDKTTEVEVSISFDLIFNELGHLYRFFYREFPTLTPIKLMEFDNYFALQYLIEVDEFELINVENDSTQLLYSIKNKYIRCTDLILNYIIEKSNDSREFKLIISKIEKEFGEILLSSSKFLPVLIEKLMVSSKKQLKNDAENFPIIEFDQTRETPANVKQASLNHFKNDKDGEEIFNTEIHYSIIKLPSINGSILSRRLIYSLHTSQNHLLLSTPLIKYYIQKK